MALGAITAVALAWGCAALLDPHRGPASVQRDARPEGSTVVTVTHRRFGHLRSLMSCAAERTGLWERDLRSGAVTTGEDLQQHCRGKLGGYKIPKQIDVSATPLPRSAAGKVLKRELRAPFWAGRERAIS